MPDQVQTTPEGPALLLRHVLARPRLVRELVRRDIRARFAGSRFGLLWSVVNPLVQLVSYALIFGFVYGGPADLPRSTFLASLFCGLWPWWGFQEGVLHGMTAIVDQAPLLKKTPIPAALCVVGQVAGSFLLQSLGFAIFLAIFVLGGLIPPRAGLLALPLVAAAGFLLATGIALALAPLYLVVRDTVHVVTAVMTILFFASPVIYRIESLPAAVQPIARWNPIAGLLGLYRACVLGLPVAPNSVLACLGGIALAWVVGARLLARLEPYLDEYW